MMVTCEVCSYEGEGSVKSDGVGCEECSCEDIFISASLSPQVNSQWKLVTRQLQKMPTLEQLLMQLSLANIASELGAMETTFSTLEERALRVEEAATNCSSCKVSADSAVN